MMNFLHPMQYLLNHIVFSWNKLSLSLEQKIWFWWGFQQNKALWVLSQINYWTKKLIVSNIRLILLDHITYFVHCMPAQQHLLQCCYILKIAIKLVQELDVIDPDLVEVNSSNPGSSALIMNGMDAMTDTTLSPISRLDIMSRAVDSVLHCE